MTNPPAPARLSVVLARRADVGVVLRRGPAKWVRMIRWDTKRDLFDPGQWFHGRVSDFPDLDLSPDGTKLVYRADKYVKDMPYPMWTAVSKPPYFTALAFWPYSYGWDASVEFVDDCTLRRWYWKPAEPPPPPDSRCPPGLQIDARPREGTRTWPLERLGWEPAAGTPAPSVYGPGVWRKPSPKGHGHLHRWRSSADRPKAGRRPRYVEYEYVPPQGSPSDLLREAEWADWDRRGRLLFAKAGKVLAADVIGPVVAVRELADLNDMTPGSVEPPEWATRW